MTNLDQGFAPRALQTHQRKPFFRCAQKTPRMWKQPKCTLTKPDKVQPQQNIPPPLHLTLSDAAISLPNSTKLPNITTNPQPQPNIIISDKQEEKT